MFTVHLTLFATHLGSTQSERGARLVRFCAALKLVFPILVVIPGLIVLALFWQELGQPGEDWDGNRVLPMLVVRLLPPGVLGLVMGAFFAGVMSNLILLVGGLVVLCGGAGYCGHGQRLHAAPRTGPVARLGLLAAGRGKDGAMIALVSPAGSWLILAATSSWIGKTVFIAVFALLIVMLIRLPPRLAGAIDGRRPWWRNVRFWAVVIVPAPIAIYAWWGWGLGI